MSAQALLEGLWAAGVHLFVEGDRLGWRAARPLRSGEIAAIKAEKPALLRLLREAAIPADRARWPELERELFEERAAILEFEAGLSRGDAERGAEAMVRERAGEAP